MIIKSLLKSINLGLSKSNTFADDKQNAAKRMKFVFEGLKVIVEKPLTLSQMTKFRL